VAYFRRQEASREPKAQVQYIKRANGEMLIRTTRPGEKPIETIAETFPPSKPPAVKPQCKEE
jgi:hypothetical protein